MMLRENGIYEHFRGGLYKAVEEVFDANTLERVVIYESLQVKGEFPKGTRWSRTLSDFFRFLPDAQRTRFVYKGEM